MITLSYDLQTDDNNHRNYLRSALERFGWQRVGGSVFRYEDNDYDDWLNRIVPSLMFFRSYILAMDIHLRFFTLDANSTTFLDHSDPAQPLGSPPDTGNGINLVAPTNNQSSERKLRDFVGACVDAI